MEVWGKFRKGVTGKRKKKVDSELSLRELKKYSTKSIDIKMIATAVTTNKPTFYIVSL